MEQEYPIICFQPDVRSLRELVYCYAVTVVQLQTFIITSLVIQVLIPYSHEYVNNSYYVTNLFLHVCIITI